MQHAGQHAAFLWLAPGGAQTVRRGHARHYGGRGKNKRERMHDPVLPEGSVATGVTAGAPTCVSLCAGVLCAGVRTPAWLPACNVW
ncbi:hypothetical protein AA16663_1638 [Komagataeibacter rhaeticus DSM 16663]|nr:hypothetical protein AA16663_1638 [Komagataeibacter rhaeticus DSM 16663]